MHFTKEINLPALKIAVDFEKNIWYFRIAIHVSVFGKVLFPPTHKTLGQYTMYWYKKLRNQRRLELWIFLPGKSGASGMPTFPINVSHLCGNRSPTSTK